MSTETTNEHITLRNKGQYEITAEDQGYFIQLFQTMRDGDDSDLILLTRAQIDRLYDFVHRHDIDADALIHVAPPMLREGKSS